MLVLLCCCTQVPVPQSGNYSCGTTNSEKAWVLLATSPSGACYLALMLRERSLGAFDQIGVCAALRMHWHWRETCSITRGTMAWPQFLPMLQWWINGTTVGQS